MSTADRIPLGVARSKLLRAVVSIDTMTPEKGEPFGRSKSGDPVNAGFTSLPLSTLLAREFDSDAHFVAYSVEVLGEDADRFPRMAKQALGQVTSHGADVLMQCVVLDFDLKDLFRRVNPATGKLAWTDLSEDEQDQIVTLLRDAEVGLRERHLLWNVFYTTRNGARFLHVLPMPMPAGRRFEAFAAKVRETYGIVGIPCDEACKDWTRLYRVPGATRVEDQGYESAQEWFHLEQQWDEFLDLPPDYDAIDDTPAINVLPLNIDRPTFEEARLFVETPHHQNGQLVLTEAAKKARRELKDGEFYGVLFEHQEIPRGQGVAHTTLTKIVGHIIGSIHGYPWASAELVYGLLAPVAQRMGDDEPWLDKAWEMVSSFWSQEDAKAAAKAELALRHKQEFEERALTAREQFLQGIREWLPDIMSMDDADAIEWIRENRLGVLMDRRKDSFRVLNTDGYYDHRPCSVKALPRVIEEMGMDWLVPTTYVTYNDRNEPVTKRRRVENIIDEDCRTFAEERCTLRHTGSYYNIVTGVFHYVPFYLRTDITPTRHQDVMHWLGLLVPKAQLNDFLTALACMLAIYEGPTAALSLVGPPATGKKMLAIGLAECFNPSREPVPGDVLTTNFNASMLKSPIVWIDEGISKGARGIDIADVFRRVVTGGATPVERKGQEIITINGVHRVIMTANNHNMLRRLGGGTARSTDDWAALGERIAHFELQKEAADYLAENGGLDFTRGWIKGDNGSPSTFRIAETLLWLFYNHLEWEEDGRPKRLGRRLLYEGKSRDVIDDLEADAGAVPEVVCAINSLLSGKQNPAAVYVEEDGLVYVMSERIVKKAAEDSRLRNADLRDALKSLCKPDDGDRPYVAGKRARWKKIDAERLVRLIEEHAALNPVFGRANEDE